MLEVRKQIVGESTLKNNYLKVVTKSYVEEDVYFIGEYERNSILWPRHLESMREHHGNRYVARQDHFWLSIMGEYAAQKILQREYGILTEAVGHIKGQRYDLVLSHDDDDDTRGYQIRSSTKTEGDLFLKPPLTEGQSKNHWSDSNNDILDDIYLQSVPLDPPLNTRWRLTGWLYGHDILEIGTPRYNGFYVGQQHLHPVLELLFL